MYLNVLYIKTFHASLAVSLFEIYLNIQRNFLIYTLAIVKNSSKVVQIFFAFP